MRRPRLVSTRCGRIWELSSEMREGQTFSGESLFVRYINFVKLPRSEEHTSELQSQSNLVCRLLLGSEEHTSELQSQSNLVCRLLLEKKKHTSELQSQSNLVCRLLLEKKKYTTVRCPQPPTKTDSTTCS